MSEDLDLVRSIYADWERGDYTSLAWVDPEIELVIADLPTAGSWRGLADAERVWGDFLAAWQGHRVEIEEYRVLDDGRVLALGRFTARGRASGVDMDELATRGANVFTVRDGKVVQLVIYFDRGHALADLGLDE
jgi:ketosteroid isomerase-like protein